MRRGGAAVCAVSFWLCFTYSGALLPSAKLFGSSSVARRMSTMRRRVGQSGTTSSSSSPTPPSRDSISGGASPTLNDAGGIGSLFWKRSFSKNTRRNTARPASSSTSDPSSESSGTSSVIHLGRLRIPQSRRLDLTTLR
ncbi:unnamed protein product [Ectocarpus sp. 12 AP-2014]